MTVPRRRATALNCEPLEGRNLLSAAGPSAVWIGQDGHDLVGTTSTMGPDGVQDIHIAISGLPAGKSVVKADIVGDGGGEWVYNGAYGPWAAAWVQSPGASTADFYMDPYRVETGRTFWAVLTYNDQTTTQVTIAGGKADPALRMPADSLGIQWVGQDGRDLTGPGPAVGPDGIQDVHLRLSGLTAGVDVTSARLTASGGAAWASGTNPGLDSNAELVPNPTDPTEADFLFNPVAGLAGQTLTLTVEYSNSTGDHASVVAGASSPSLRMPPPAPISLTWSQTIATTWLGQDGQGLAGPGSVHVSIAALPAGRTVVSATLSDEAGGEWIYEKDGTPVGSIDPNAFPLAFLPSASDPSRADLGFVPIRDETNSSLTLRLVLDDATMLATRVAGGACNLGLLAPAIAPTSIVAHPGDDLNALANQYGTVHLASGTYNLAQPLVLDHPVTVSADPGTILEFSQAANAPTWTAAIKIQCGNTTLEGFSVRFSGPIRWNLGTSYGPAVIGTTDNFDGAPLSPLVNLTLTHLDLMSPPAASSWEEAPRMIRLASAQSGVISDNTLKGGVTEFLHGPWQITGNDYQGTVPGTYADGAFAGHFTHDVVVADNHVEPVGSSGKTWRFLVFTQSGIADVVSDNVVVGVGPLDTDTMPNPNASEVLLTEAYTLFFEGRPASISPDGTVIQVPGPQTGPARTGEVLAILAGPDAGQWRMIAQAISPTAYLLDAPISPADTAVSLAMGFVNETYQGNTINTQGSTSAQDLVLGGNQFGAQVLDNTLSGGAWGIEASASPSQAPDFWGWSHAPILGLVVQGNTIQDTQQGSKLVVEHNQYIKTDQGRVYLSAKFVDNTFAWSAAFLGPQAGSGQQGAPPSLAIGDTQATEPSELLLSAAGNEFQSPTTFSKGPAFPVSAATVNGQVLTKQAIAIPAVLAAPTGLRLVNDSGVSSSDGLTNDGRLEFAPIAPAAGYEYSLSGNEGTYLPVASPSGFLPAGLVPGANTVYVRGFDAASRRGLASSITFAYDTQAPGPVTGLATSENGQVQFQGLGPGFVYEYRTGSSQDEIALGSSTSFTVPGLLKGSGVVLVHAVDLAGNVGPDTLTTVTPHWVPITWEAETSVVGPSAGAALPGPIAPTSVASVAAPEPASPSNASPPQPVPVAPGDLSSAGTSVAPRPPVFAGPSAWLGELTRTPRRSAKGGHVPAHFHRGPARGVHPFEASSPRPRSKTVVRESKREDQRSLRIF